MLAYPVECKKSLCYKEAVVPLEALQMRHLQECRPKEVLSVFSIHARKTDLLDVLEVRAAQNEGQITYCDCSGRYLGTRRVEYIAEKLADEAKPCQLVAALVLRRFWSAIGA